MRPFPFLLAISLGIAAWFLPAAAEAQPLRERSADRLSSLEPGRPTEYFELAEELAEMIRTPDDAALVEE
ncbi:MAG: hypothetical protein AAFR96_08100, partial [Planctomycetota bacterium]